MFVLKRLIILRREICGNFSKNSFKIYLRKNFKKMGQKVPKIEIFFFWPKGDPIKLFCICDMLVSYLGQKSHGSLFNTVFLIILRREKYGNFLLLILV